jgi:hypothetical protein
MPALPAEIVGQQAADVRIVIHDQDARRCGGSRHGADITTEFAIAGNRYKSVQNRLCLKYAGYMPRVKWAPCFNPDDPLGREMMARRFARQFCCLGGVHGYSMDDEQAAKMTAKSPPALT